MFLVDFWKGNNIDVRAAVKKLRGTLLQGRKLLTSLKVLQATSAHWVGPMFVDDPPNS